MIPVLIAPIRFEEEGDLDYEEKAVKVVVTYLQAKGEADKGFIKEMVKLKGTERADGWGLEETDWDVLQTYVGTP